MGDDDELARLLRTLPTPLERAQKRVAFALAEQQLRDRRDHRGRRLRAEVRRHQIAVFVKARLERVGTVEAAVMDAAEEFGVSDGTVWKAWRRSAAVLNTRPIAAK